jgi:hypothetical protein
MIEIRKNPDPQSRIEYLLFIDGALLENAPISSSADGYWITVRDFETSAKIAEHSLSEFPPFRYINLWSYPKGIQHLSISRSDGAFIHRDFKKNEKTGEYEDADSYTVSLALGKSALSQWRSPYSFADYACEMYQILEDNTWVTGLSLTNSDQEALDRRREEDDEGNPVYIKVDIDQIDRTRIFGLEMTFRYSSPEVKIEDELKRISEIIAEGHNQVERLLTPPTYNSVEILRIEGSSAYGLFVNGNMVNASIHFPYLLADSEEASINFDSPESLGPLGRCSFTELPSSVHDINIKSPPQLKFQAGLVVPWEDISIGPPPAYLLVGLQPDSPLRAPFHIVSNFVLDVKNWKGVRTPVEYMEDVQNAFLDCSNVLVSYSAQLETTFRIAFAIATPEVEIGDEFSRCVSLIRRRLQALEDDNTSPHSLTIEIPNLPGEVRVACEQYLVYFVQFLRDLGVDATSELKYKAGQVLFTVTPANEEDALDKIRAALDVYLHLPASPVSNDMGNEVAIQRLESQVLRFQSDLKLAAAELQAKNATIEAQQLTISVQKALLNGEILLDSMKDVTPKPKEDDKEELLGGTVALTKTNWKGVELNLPEIFRRLRRLFKEDE